jgi:phosphoglycolate phosphatase-like HAD superfamily hydrolase
MRTILFDWDGTIVDSVGALYETDAAICRMSAEDLAAAGAVESAATVVERVDRVFGVSGPYGLRSRLRRSAGNLDRQTDEYIDRHRGAQRRQRSAQPADVGRLAQVCAHAGRPGEQSDRVDAPR